MIPQSPSHIIFATVARSVSPVHDFTPVDINSFTFIAYLLSTVRSGLFRDRRARAGRRLERINHDLGRVAGRRLGGPSARADRSELVFQCFPVLESADDLHPLPDIALEVLFWSARQSIDAAKSRRARRCCRL